MGADLAVITGASSGIGWELGLQLAARGYDLLLVARREERLEKLAAQIRSMASVKTDLLRCDLVSPADRRALITRLDGEKNRLSLVVNNAGFGAFGATLEIPVARALEMIELNIGALTELSAAAARILVPKRAGGIINVASTAAFQAVPYLGVYSATKAYVLSFTEALAEELQGQGVRVMALCPGYTRTEFQQVSGESLESSGRRRMMSAADCVRLGLRDYEAGRRVSVTGAGNKIQTLASRLFPRRLVVHFAGALVKGRVGIHRK
jgi:short-subunit dehydrogenase